MPPDLNTVPPSPKPQDKAPPPVPREPHSALVSPTLPSASMAAVEETQTSPRPGPMRHRCPLTVEELHSLLEEEQERIVNRLNRELSDLRAQTASVASNASSTSSLAASSFNEPASSAQSHVHSQHQYGHQIPSPISARRHRSSSSVSARSGRSITGAAPGTTGATSVSGVAPARDLPPTTTATSSSRPSSQQTAGAGSGMTGQGGLASPAARYEELIAQREELEVLKRENESLRRRIKELEVEMRSLNVSALGSDIPYSTAGDEGA